jgi:hypothetical protein
LRRIGAALIALLALVTVRTNAQHSTPSDNAIGASYCLGYFIAQNAAAKKQFSCEGDPVAAEACMRRAYNGAPTPLDKVARIMPLRKRYRARQDGF